MAILDLSKATPEPEEQPTEPEPQLNSPSRTVGPCEATFNQMMAEVQAQMQREAVRARLAASPGIAPKLDMFALMKGMMRGIDVVLAEHFGEVYEEIEAVAAMTADVQRSIDQLRKGTPEDRD